MQHTAETIKELVSKQRDYFKSGITLDATFRINMLKKFRECLMDNEKNIYEALHKDLRKPEIEAFGSEFFGIYHEAEYAIKNLKKWMRPKRVSSPLLLFPGKAEIFPEPYGNLLIIGPWNYPFELALTPMVGAIAAGNNGIIKTSEFASASADLMEEMLSSVFPEEYFTVVQGDHNQASWLLKEKFDYLFFTGSTKVGKIVMEAAAKNLTPVTLELGGKSPVIIDKDANVALAAKRVAWGKFFNAGQTCIAPDYLYVHESVKKQFVVHFNNSVNKFYEESPWDDISKIINRTHYDRLRGFLENATIVTGGVTVPEENRISPTLLDDVNWDHPVMKEEIFGPILPMITFTSLDEVIDKINSNPKPLALYFFSKNKKNQEKIKHETSSGGISINDTLGHFMNKNLPFGGVGESGIGKYHKEASFDTFSHRKSIQYGSSRIDIPLKYPPYNKKIKLIKKLMKYIAK